MGSFFKTLSVFLGTIIGVGIFGLPFVALEAGFFVVLAYLLVISFLVSLLLCIYGKVAVNTESFHRLPGYIGEYLGEKWEKVSFAVISLGLIGTLLAYLIIGGEFLDSLFGGYFGHNTVLYTLVFFVPAAYLIFRGIKSVSGIELALFFALLLVISFFFVKAFPFIEIRNLESFKLSFLPYGVVLFAFTSSAIVPEIKEMIVFSLKKKDNRMTERKLKKLIVSGMVFVLLIYILFIIIVLGASGSFTSKDAISGLEESIGGNWIKLGFVFGVISCFTSFLTLGLTMKKILCYDINMSKTLSWALTCFVPLLLFFLGLRRFIEIIGFTGAVAVGAEGIMIVFLYRAFLKKKLHYKMSPFYYSLVVVFSLGIISEILSFFY